MLSLVYSRIIRLDPAESMRTASTSVCGSFAEAFHNSTSIILVVKASPPHRGLAREEVVVVVDGREQRLAIVRQDRIHGQEAYWLCPRCGSARMHLFLLNGEIGCRGCFHLSYAVQRTRNRAALRARKLRRKLGAAASLFAPLPPRPRNVWAAARYDRLARELAICEAALAQRLRDMVGRRRKRA